MGAWATTQYAAGKTMQEAYDRAVDDARAEYGHQEGYSGAINSKEHGFIPVELPPRFTFEKLERLIADYFDAQMEVEGALYAVEMNGPGGAYHGKRGAKGNLRKAEVGMRRAQAKMARVEKQIPSELLYRFADVVEAFNDKWGPPLAVELRPAEAAKHGPRRRGEKVYVFFGYAPC